jgi:cholesterol transport system auxiliary component
MMRALLPLLLAALLAGCKALPDKPVQETMYDFGPSPAVPLEPGLPARPPLLLSDVQVGSVLEGTEMLYRLAYENPQELRPYAFARWSSPPGELVHQRLRDVLGRDRAVLDPRSASTLTRRGGPAPPVLRLELDEFSQVFASPAQSEGVLRLRVTLLESTPGGEKLVAQRRFEARRPAPSADAAGGVRALAAAAEAVAADIAAWLRER